jgi:hypothetical protein
MKRHRLHEIPPGRRGVLSIELLLTLPIFGILLMGLFEYSLLFGARGDVAAACRAGCRRATFAGATSMEVEAEVLSHLSPRMAAACSVNSELGEHTGDVVAVAVQVPMNIASPDLLWPVGFGLSGNNIVCQSRMVKE